MKKQPGPVTTRQHVWETPTNRFVTQRLLGYGTSGNTFLAVDAHGKQVAVKVMKDRRSAMDEFDILKRLAPVCFVHHFLCPIALHEQPKFSLVVTTFISGYAGTTFLRPNMRPHVTTLFLTRYCLHLLDALRAIHALGVAHNDIKLENIMVNDAMDRFTLIDFGLATTKPQRFLQGTDWYVHPRVFEEYRYAQIVSLPTLFSSDLFAFGVILYELAEAGRYPFKRLTKFPRSFTKYRSIPYGFEAGTTFPTKHSAKLVPDWMAKLFEITTLMTVHKEYRGRFTAACLYHALDTENYAFLDETVENFVDDDDDDAGGA